MALGNGPASALRARLSDLLRSDGSERQRVEAEPICWCRWRKSSSIMPCEIAGYTDFFTSIYHAERGGRVRNPSQPLTPNFKHIPIGYNGRATSIRASGESFKRPNGQYRDKDGVASLRPGTTAGLRAGGWRSHRARQSARRADPACFGARPHLRILPSERLVGPRDPGLGNGSGRSVPGQDVLLHDLAVDRHRRGAGAVSLPELRARARRSAAAALSRRSCEREGRRHRPDSGSLSSDAAHAFGRPRGRADHAHQPDHALLDLRSDGDLPRQQRLQFSAGRHHRQRHDARGPRTKAAPASTN